MTDVPPIGRATPYVSDVVLFAPPAPKQQDAYHITRNTRSGTSVDCKLRQDYRKDILREREEKAAARRVAAKIKLANVDAHRARLAASDKLRSELCPDRCEQAPHEDVVYIEHGAKPMNLPPPVVAPAKPCPTDQARRLAEIQERTQRRKQLERNRLRREATQEHRRQVVPTKTTLLSVVVETVCQTLGVLRSDLIGTRRKHEALARELIVYVARKNTTAVFAEIADAMQKTTACVQEAMVRVCDRWDRRVGLYYVADRPTRFDGMTYRAVAEEIEARIADHSVASTDMVPGARIAEVEARLRARGMLAGGGATCNES